MAESDLPPFVVLFGPTASGKTALLHSIAAAVAGGIEVISADSMQVYRGMDIGTAKPDACERACFPHHLIDIRNPDERYTAGEFVNDASAAILAANRRGAAPVVSGGTAFYLRCLLYGMPQTPPSDPHVRGELERQLAIDGIQPLRAELTSVDPQSALAIAKADTFRLLRALEIYRLTGKPRSSFSDPREQLHEPTALVLGLDRPREKLYKRIDERVEAMFRAGLPEEVERLRRSGYGSGAPGMRAIGYREFFEGATDVKGLIQRNTRRYAKRQMTFARRIGCIEWVAADDHDAVVRRVAAFLGTSTVGRAQ